VAVTGERVGEPEAAPPPSRAGAEWGLWTSRTGGWSRVLRVFRWLVAHPVQILLAGVLIAVALNFWETRGQTFYSDEWGRLFFPSSDNDSFESLLRWRSGHLVVVHVLLYKGLFGLFGADSYLPFRIIEALLVGVCGALFYALARVRARPWPCVFATLVLLFLGSAWEVTATPYGTVVLLPVAFGLAALVCLERFPRRGDALACLLLIAALASHSDGLAFLAGAAVLLILQSGRAFLARIWVVLVPGFLYVAWLAWYRLTVSGATPEPVQPHNLGEVPSTVLSVFAAGLSAISGFFGSSGPGGVPFNLEAGYLLVGLLAIAAVWRVRGGWPVPREIWVPVVFALTFWVLLGMVASSERTPTESRYIYPSAVFLLLILLESTRDIRPTLPIVLLGVGALLVSLVPNAVNLHEQARRIRAAAADERVALGTVELLRKEVPSDSLPYLARRKDVLSIGGEGFRVAPVTYFDAFDRYGSPAASAQQIASSSEQRRLTADRALLQADDLTLDESPADGSDRVRDCSAAPKRSRGSGKRFSVPAAGLEIRPLASRSDVRVEARRFAAGFQRVDVPEGSGPTVLKPGRSQEVRPWVVRVRGASVCTLR
jgi:hypothetical protein